MEKVPQIVSERLKAAPPVVEHPDADVLTAFSELSLPQTERKTVLEHLARCGECREIVALALPASEPMQPIAHPAHGRWLAWPGLRWGLIGAGILAIASFGVMQYQRRSQMMAYNSSRSEAANKVATALPTITTSGQSAEDKIQTPASVQAEEKGPAASGAGPASALESSAPTVIRRDHSKGGQVSGALPYGPRVQWQQNATNQQQAQMQAIPSQAKELRGQVSAHAPTPSPAVSQAASASEQSSVVSSNMGAPVLETQSIDQQPLQGHADLKIERIKPAGTSTVSALKALTPDLPPPGVAAGAPLAKNSQYAGFPGVPTRWTISSTGGLQRSFDQGSTWQNVDVNNSTPAAPNLALMKAPSRAKELANEQVATDGSLGKDKD